MRRSQHGFTLIEIIVVIAIVALVAGLGVSGVRRLAMSDLRTSSAQMSGAIRYLFDRASTTGKVHRLVIDMNDGKYWAEVSDDKFYVPHEAESETELRRREEKEADEDEEKRRKEEERARDEQARGTSTSSSSFDLSKLEIGDFKPRRARFAAFSSLALKPVSVKKAKIRSVYTPRVTDALTTGRAYIYFFPLGQTEPAIVTMSNPEGDTVFSLVVHPITGRVRIYNREVLPPGVRTDDEGRRVME